MKKILFILMLLAFACPAMALVQHQVSIVDEFGVPITTITSITVFNSGLGTSPTIFSDRAGDITVTNPITPSSDNSTFDQSIGLVRWFQTKPTYKLTITDGTKTLTVDGLNESNTKFAWYDNYIGTAASLSVNDNQSITVGTDLDMVLAWNNGSDFMSWIPASDGSAFNLGTSGNSKNVDFNWFVDTALGIKGDEGNATLDIDGLDITLNENTNGTTGINNGTSTGAITIGSTTSGTLAFDTTSGITMNADDSIAVTTSAGTIGLGATGGDITIDGVDSSVIIRGSEAAADAILLDVDNAAGGIDIDAGTGSIDIDVTGGDITIDNDGAGKNLDIDITAGSIYLDAGEATANAIAILATAGGVDITTAATFDIDLTATGGTVQVIASEAAANQFKVDAQGAVAGIAIQLETTSGGIHLLADHSTNGDITLDAEDDIILTTTGALTITNTSAMTVSGASTLTGAVTATAGIQAASVSVTATVDGLTTGLIPSGTSFVTVTSDGATKVVVLPASVIGNIVWITVPATGCELQTLATTNETINTVDCDGTNELALVAGSIYRLVCTKAITWVATGASSLGANEDSLTPDAD